VPNPYCNLTPSNKISEDFQNITAGFDAVKTDMDGKAPASVGTTLTTHIGSRGAAHGNATTSEAGFQSASDKSKLNGIETGAEKNKPAFASVNDVAAGTPEDTLTVEGGTGITVTTNPTTKKMTITATGEATPGAHGPSHTEFGSDPVPNATPSEGGLMSAADKTKLDGMDGDFDDLAGPGRTTETVKGNADAIAAQKAETVTSLFNVVFYGADPTGATDSSAAIQAAINAAAAAGGGIVYFPRGIYLIGTTLSWTADNITLKGQGMDVTLIRDHSSLGANRLIFLQGSTGDRIENTNIEDITLRNGTATTGNPTMGKDCIRAEYVDGLRIRRCKITEVQGDYGVAVKYARNVSVIKSKFYRWTYAGMYVLIECDIIRVLDNEFDTAVSTTVANVYTVGTGGETASQGSYYLRNMWIERNVFRNNPRWEGIDSHGGENIWIRDNYVENCKAGINCAIATGFVSNPVLKNLTIEGNVVIQGSGEDGLAGINVGGAFSPGVLITAENITIRNNNVNGFGGTTSNSLGTLQTYWASNVDIDNNDIREFAQFGINLYIGVWGARVRNNRVYNARGGFTPVNISGICVNRSGGCIGSIVEHNRIGADTESKRPAFGISAENIYLSTQIRNNQIENVATGLYGNVAQLPIEKSAIPTTNLIQKYGDVIFSDSGKPGWYATAPKIGFASLNAATLVTVNISSGSKVATIATNSGAAYWALPPGANISIAGAGAAGVALTARVVKNDGTNLTLDTAAGTTVSGANLTYQALTVAT